VSIYSCALGWHLANTPQRFVIKAHPYGWLELYLDSGPATIATLLLAGEMLKVGSDNAYAKRMREEYRRKWPQLHAKTVERVKIHWFRADRPGQHRGIPEITPGLPILAQLRRFTLATLDAAESAANFAMVMQTNAPANGAAATVPGDSFELSRNMATTLPEGWTLGQTDPKHPSTTYQMFKCELIREYARCMSVPYNIAAGDSSGYNYASGRLDHQTYFRMIRVEQLECEELVMDRIFEAWLAEAILVSDYLPIAARALPEYPHQWFWDGREHVDPAKEANAQAQRLASNTTTLATEYAKQGQDWEVQIRQRAKEVALMKKLGLPTEEAKPALQSDKPQPDDRTAPSAAKTGDKEDDSPEQTEEEDD
jgi:capsid protein